MALADYFFRDAVAISQVLQGFQKDHFVERLENVQVAVTFGEEAASSQDGRALLDLSVRLFARLYPRMVIVSTSTTTWLADELSALATDINPNIGVATTGTPNICLMVGTGAPTADAPTVYAGCNGWRARIGNKGPYKVSDTGNPYGAGFAACLAAANVFRFLFLPEGATLLDGDVSFPSDTSAYPDLVPSALGDPLVLAGVGAVGNGTAWALSRTPIASQVHLVDPEAIELSNLQRYVLCKREDEGNAKVETVSKQFGGPLEALPSPETWASFAEANGYKWERVLVALDSARDRRAVQGSLPRWIANAWTQVGDLGVSTHAFLGRDACLACLYLPTEISKNEDQIMAEGLRVPQFQNLIRVLLGSGRGVGRELCDAVAAAWSIPVEVLASYEGRPIRELWVDGICGGGIIPLGDAGPAPRELQVPLAFQSTLAGVLLAAEAVRDVLTSGAGRKTLVRRIDVMRPLNNVSRRPARKAGTGHCICEDPDFLATYKSKYGL